MPRLRKCNICPDWHETEAPWPQACVGHFKRHLGVKRSAFAAPAIITDDLGPNGLLNHADGRVYTSKAKYMQAVRDAGCEAIGSEKVPRPTHHKPKLSDDLKRDIRQWVEAKNKPVKRGHARA